MICYDDINQNKAEIALILDTVISEKTYYLGEEGHFVMRRGR